MVSTDYEPMSEFPPLLDDPPPPKAGWWYRSEFRFVFKLTWPVFAFWVIVIALVDWLIP